MESAPAFRWLKPRPNRRKSTRVFDLRSTCVSFGHPLALTCVDFGRAQIRTQIDTSWSQVICICVKFICCDLCELVSWLANPFGIRLRKSVRKSWFCKLALTCIDLRVRLARIFSNNKIQDSATRQVRQDTTTAGWLLSQFSLDNMLQVFEWASKACNIAAWTFLELLLFCCSKNHRSKSPHVTPPSTFKDSPWVYWTISVA